MKNRIAVFISEGFEEIEAITCVDVLRRAENNVKVVGVGSTLIKGSHGVSINADIDIESYEDFPDVVILPGGLPNAENLAKSKKLANIIMDAHKKKKLIAAICASPAYVLAPLGILDGKKATCYPGCENKLSDKTEYRKDNVVLDGNIITGKGPGSAIEFSLKIIEKLCGADLAKSVAEKLIYET